MRKNIKCDVDKRDFIEVKAFPEDTPPCVNISVEELGMDNVVEFQSPQKMDRLIKALTKARRKVWGEAEVE